VLGIKKRILFMVNLEMKMEILLEIIYKIVVGFKREIKDIMGKIR
jgi:hypothetical protein